MSTNTIPQHINHLLQVMRQARRLGWQLIPRHWIPTPDSQPRSCRWCDPATGAAVNVEQRMVRGRLMDGLILRRRWEEPTVWLPVRSVTEAVDILVAFGILPAAMSSMWIAGHLTWRNPRRRIINGYMTWCPCCGDDLWCIQELEKIGAA